MAELVTCEDSRWLHPDDGSAPFVSTVHCSQERDDPHDSRLVDALRRMDPARCTRTARSREDARALWLALLAGQFAILESFDRDGRRIVLAVRDRSRRQVLTPREAAVVRAAARGLSNKEIGSELGMATGTVGVHLASALRKLGLPNRRGLIQWLPELTGRR